MAIPAQAVSFNLLLFLTLLKLFASAGKNRLPSVIFGQNSDKWVDALELCLTWSMELVIELIKEKGETPEIEEGEKK